MQVVAKVHRFPSMHGETAIRKRLFQLAAGVLVAACGGGGGGGPTGPPTANIVGHYSVTHTGTLSGLPAVSCPGEINITSQTGSSFSGTISITATEDCQGVAGSGTITGVLTNGGSFDATITVPSLDALLESLSCTIVGGDPDFSGSAGTAGITASRTIELTCDIEGGTLETVFEYMVAGPKT